MKKLVFPLIVLSLLSCSKDGTGFQNTAESKNDAVSLTSIKIDNYTDNVLTSTTEEFYENGVLIRSESTSGIRSTYEYKNGLVQTVHFFDQKGIQTRTITYRYDAKGRLTNRLNTPLVNLDNNIPFERSYQYNDGSIIGVIKFYDNSFNLVHSDTITFDLNGEGLITKSELNQSDGPWGATIAYQDQTPQTFQYYGWRTDFQGKVLYEYNEKNELGCIPHQSFYTARNGKTIRF